MQQDKDKQAPGSEQAAAAAAARSTEIDQGKQPEPAKPAAAKPAGDGGDTIPEGYADRAKDETLQLQREQLLRGPSRLTLHQLVVRVAEAADEYERQARAVRRLKAGASSAVDPEGVRLACVQRGAEFDRAMTVLLEAAGLNGFVPTLIRTALVETAADIEAAAAEAAAQP
jgi:hypothetical protein